MRARVLIIGLLLILPVVATAAGPSWTETLTVCNWIVPELHNTSRGAIEDEQERKLDYQGIFHRIETKEKMIDDLLAGRRSLADVAAQFSVLNEGFEDHLSVIRVMYPGVTDEEKMLWNVVDYARYRMSHLSTWRRLEFMTRLHTDLLASSVEFAAPQMN